jgi:hypothetical protein
MMAMSFSVFASTGRKWIRSIRKRLPAPPFERRCRLYCTGTPKSGTHSISEMFVKPLRSGHEIEYHRLADKIMAASAGRTTAQSFRKWILRRDWRIRLDVDSSTLNFFILDMLLEEFGDARFVLTLRDCYSWLNSMANHAVRYPQKHWQPFRDFRFRPDLHVHTAGDRVFKENGLHTLEGYLSYWARHNQESLAKIPAERLMVVRTDQISQRAIEIARFAGLSPDSINPKQTHGFQNPAKRDFLSELDRDYLEAKVCEHCRPLMRRFFPEITSLNDARVF